MCIYLMYVHTYIYIYIHIPKGISKGPPCASNPARRWICGISNPSAKSKLTWEGQGVLFKTMYTWATGRTFRSLGLDQISGSRCSSDMCVASTLRKRVDGVGRLDHSLVGKWNDKTKCGIGFAIYFHLNQQIGASQNRTPNWVSFLGTPQKMLVFLSVSLQTNPKEGIQKTKNKTDPHDWVPLGVP